MKLIRFLVDDMEKLGVADAAFETAYELNTMKLSRYFFDMFDVIRFLTEEDRARVSAVLAGSSDGVARYDMDRVELLSPIARPIHDILCVGVNYRAHIAEVHDNLDQSSFHDVGETVYFAKRTTGIVGPGGTIESHGTLDERLDYEAELAVIIGRDGRDIPYEQAEDYIFGYSVFNDVSARALQKRHHQWYRGKSLDGFVVMGPCIVTKDELPFPLELELESRVNGKVRQHSNTRLFLHNIPDIISEFSNGITLEAGDIIATGTPAGTGMSFDPPRFMKPGDVVECEIEKIGVLKNTIR